MLITAILKSLVYMVDTYVLANYYIVRGPMVNITYVVRWFAYDSIETKLPIHYVITFKKNSQHGQASAGRTRVTTQTCKPLLCLLQGVIISLKLTQSEKQLMT
jgi:hypothetical protein